MKAIVRAVKSILNGFTDLINFIQTVFRLILNFLSEIVYLIKYLLQAVNLAATFIAQLPPWLKVYATVTVTICVLYVVLGREGGKN